MNVEHVVSLFVVGVWVLLSVRGIYVMLGMVRLQPGEPVRSGRVTCIVPARNEVEVIESSVAGLLAQGGLRIVIIDDRSTDGTAERLRSIDGIEVVDGAGPGAGECGKPAAIRDALRERPPKSDWLLFIDADVVITEGAVSSLLRFAEQRGADLVSGFPRMVLGSTLERIIMPAVGSVVFAQRGRRPFANGQLILVKRAVYEAVGGHASVVGEILEDVRLAERVVASGGRIEIADLREIAATRMYANWVEMREGWSKNLYLLVGGPGRVIVWAVLSVVLGGAGVAALLAGGWPSGVLAYAAVLTMQSGLRKLGGSPPLWAVFAPIGGLVTAYLLLRSMMLHRTGRSIPWKGRAY